MQIIVDDLLISYELKGRGKLILMLHGWGDSRQGLASISRILANRFQVLALDLPGMGGSQPPAVAWDLDNYADFLKDLLIKLDLKQPYVIIGHSNGAALAIRAAATHKLSPKKLILIGAAGIRNQAKPKKTMIKYLTKIGGVLTSFLPEYHRNKLRKRLYNAVGSDMLLMSEMEDTFKKIVDQDVQADAAQIKLPVLLIYGQNDQATPVKFGEIYQSLMPGAELRVINKAGHFVHQDQPGQVQPMIEDFLR